VSAEEHMANYQAARALMGKSRNTGEGAVGLSRNGLRKQTAGLSKSSAKKSAVKNHAAVQRWSGTNFTAGGAKPSESA